ncbi:hypothetical protein [Flavobacterium sp. ACN6]|uniref:hypothetical protein n=1 Tax=Flavobacterium sp. ACN6 TaxID=1920426 RepID=UPI000BB36B10|nr:hypothetical protein [Flavobacterium sp. ACN6]PBJ11909.1 hypothetical protein BSF42_26410 [Flavobacterium sp. ACN6]
MRNKILLLGMLFLLLNSCKNKDELGLTNPTKKWVYYNYEKKYEKNNGSFITYLKFEDNGKCTNFFFDKNEGQYGAAMNWKFTTNDSILNISDNKYLILKVYKDSILMKDLKYSRNVKLLNWNVIEK